MRALLLLLALVAPSAQAQPAPIRIVAAEAVYADIGRQIAGSGAAISSILNSPDEDPHLFEASPSIARALAGAQIVVMNGANYDPWMRTLLRAAPRADRRLIDVGQVVRAAPGANPHLWYAPADRTGLRANHVRATGDHRPRPCS